MPVQSVVSDRDTIRYNGVSDDSAGNTRLIAQFFASIGAAYWARDRSFNGGGGGGGGGAGGGAGDLPLHVFVTTQSEQAARWSIMRNAREALFYLEAVMPFDPEALPGYVPKKTQPPLEPLELKRPVTFVFRPCRPLRFGLALPPAPAPQFGDDNDDL